MTTPLADRTLTRLRALAAELAPFPGRGQFALRLTLASAIAIIIGETLQIPYTVMALVAIFFTVQANVAMTRVIFAALTIADTIAVVLLVILLNFTYDYPLLRIVTSAVLFFSFMFCVRVSKAGAILLGPALVILYAQSFADLTGQAEYLVKQVLWSIAAITYGSVIALLVNTLFPSANPLRQLRDETHRQLGRAIERLRRLAAGELAAAPLSVQALQRQSTTLQNLIPFASMGNAKDATARLYLQSCVAAVSHVERVCNTLPATLPDSSPALRSALQGLQEALLALDAAITHGTPFQLAWAPAPQERAALQTLSQAEDLYHTLQALGHFDNAGVTEREPAPVKEPLVAPDALTNPAYVRFALKVLICGLSGYFVFNVLQWPGIHTILITSGMVALPGLGTSVRQMTLRFYGALAGSLCALLVFLLVMPRIDTIFGLLLAMIPVIGLGAWVAAGSERLAYIGTQGAATFSLALLEHFGPSTDLTEIRDRMVGIMLGVGICWLVYSFLWPESEGGNARSKLASLMQAIAALVRAPVRRNDPMAQLAYDRQNMLCWSTLNDCTMQVERVRYERQFRRGALAKLVEQADTLLAASRDLLVAQDLVRAQTLASGLPDGRPNVGAAIATDAAVERLKDETANLIELYAQRIAQHGEPPLREQAQLSTQARQTVEPAAAALVAHMQRLALHAAALPGWDTNDANPTETDGLRTETRNTPKRITK
ncbi:FUSC family protein [Paraburkholderia sp. J67]|uniref:FUSC family protein n=1 Tax=Paraburkholderia sp. J67 TaxID=2805435 RepID=UPI002ABE0230|nr:FUSC family protein [Paraburkholderia sp. J67]